MSFTQILEYFRVAWIIVVISVLTAFVYAISARYSYLYTYPTNIEIDVGYPETVPFPAVTICNQNKYR